MSMGFFSFLSFMNRQRGSGYEKCPSRKPGYGTLLSLEALESRYLLSCNIISGYVFNDINDNGIIDPGESGLANSTIVLKNAAGVVIGSTVSDVNGYYQFTTDNTIGTAPATLVRTLTVPSAPTDWLQSLSVAQFDPSLGTLTSVDIINAGSFTSRIAVESKDAASSTITATVSGSLTLSGPGVSALVTSGSTNETFNASAFDGIVDFAGTSGHDFGAQTASGTNSRTISAPSDLAAFEGTGSVVLNLVAHATSAASGAGNLITQIRSSASAQVTIVYHYLPSRCLRPGNYTIVQTQEPAGYWDGKDSANGVVLPNSIGSDAIPVALGNANAPNNDFGEIRPASLSGFVYLDRNDDGLFENNESGIAGVTVTLAGITDQGTGVNVAQTTGADGSYHFVGLRPGVYNITETQPASYLEGMNSLGSAGGTVGNDQFLAIGLGSGINGVQYNFGELLPANPTSIIYSASFGTTGPVFAQPPDLTILSKQEFLSSGGTLDPTVKAEAFFVDALYRNLLGRPVDLPSLVNWVGALQNGMSRQQLVQVIWESPEHRGVEVDHLYATFLRRPADPGGRAAYVNALLSGASEAQIAEALLDSSEYQSAHPDNGSYVASLYANILGRAGSVAEISGWVAALQSGLSRDALATMFLNSAEADQRILESDYQMFLRRPADTAGEQALVAVMQSGQVTPEAAGEILLSSDEYYAMAVEASLH
jgi:hypothetical protein